MTGEIGATARPEEAPGAEAAAVPALPPAAGGPVVPPAAGSASPEGCRGEAYPAPDRFIGSGTAAAARMAETPADTAALRTGKAGSQAAPRPKAGAGGFERVASGTAG